MLYKNVNVDVVMVGEVWFNIVFILFYVMEEWLDLCFDFDLVYGIIVGVNGEIVMLIWQQLAVIQEGYFKFQYVIFLINYDIDCIYSQFEVLDYKMKQVVFIYLMLFGVFFIYYGEEVGMLGIGVYENICCFMQWIGGVYVGFINGNFWIGVGGGYMVNNVVNMESNFFFLFSIYWEFVYLCNEEEVFCCGYLLDVQFSLEEILSYVCILEEEALVMVVNMGFNSFFNIIFNFLVFFLFVGEYCIIEIWLDIDMGMFIVNVIGGIENWVISNVVFDVLEIWVFCLLLEMLLGIVLMFILVMDVKVFFNLVVESVMVRLDGDIGAGLVYLFLLWFNGQVLEMVMFFEVMYCLDFSDYFLGLYFVRLQWEGCIQVLKLMISCF